MPRVKAIGELIAILLQILFGDAMESPPYEALEMSDEEVDLWQPLTCLLGRCDPSLMGMALTEACGRIAAKRTGLSERAGMRTADGLIPSGSARAAR